mgnify:FL=1
MAFSPDVLTTALQELMPGFSETFTKFHPAFDAIIMKGNKRQAQGPYIQFALVPDGPGFLTQIVSGNEVIAGGRKQNSVRATEFAATMIYAYDVPGQDLREANNKMDLVELIRRYPERSLAEFHELIARQLVMGDVTDANNFLTWNGDATYDPKGLGPQQGIFSFQDAASQTTDAFGVAKNSITGWHNQYQHIASFTAEGRRKLREAYYDASQEMANTEGDVDLMFADRATFDNYIDDLDDQVQIVTRSTRDGDRAPGKMREGIKFLNAVMYPEQYIVPANFITPAATEGVCYGIHSSTWKLFTMGGSMGGADATKGFFDSRGPVRLPTQDMWRYEYVLSLGMYCDQLRCNFAVTGGGNP